LNWLEGLVLFSFPFFFFLFSLIITFFKKLELFFDRGNDYVFLSRENTLAPAGALEKSTSVDFKFSDLELPHESYNGINVRLR